MSKYIAGRWQSGDDSTNTRLWAHEPGGAVIIADFGVSSALRDEVKKANMRRARTCVNFAIGTSTEQIEEMMKRNISLGDVIVAREDLLEALREVCIGVSRAIGGSVEDNDKLLTSLRDRCNAAIINNARKP